ncbi:MAG: hypothetical protein CVV12_01035 [Gammaproteobacteria bacterium HGW-Gammaproteobacteria-2]|nr:MAG: hypothetical protein CVV12_01035 [Gammaproteobacteria bacterium HGW-Gammaproteobacteria-2]
MVRTSAFVGAGLPANDLAIELRAQANNLAKVLCVGALPQERSPTYKARLLGLERFVATAVNQRLRV